MHSGQISSRELLSNTGFGQGINMEYNIDQLKKDNTNNSIDQIDQIQSLKSEDNIFQVFDSKKSQKLSVGSQHNSKYTDSNLLEKPSIGKIQPSLSRRKLQIQQQSPKFLQPNILKENSKSTDQLELLQNIIKKNYLVKHFINKMTNQSCFKPKQIHENFEDELSSLKSNDNKFNGNSNQSFNNHLLPSSNFIKIWDAFYIIIYLLNFLIILFIFSFSKDETVFVQPIETILFVMFVMDALVESKRALNIQGEIITEKTFILQHYRSTQLFEDIIFGISQALLIATIGQFDIANEILTLIQVVILFSKIQKKYSYCVDSLFLKGTLNNALYDLITLIIVIICFAHSTACVWHYIGYITSSNGESWLIYYELLQKGVLIRYNYSFYWATMTMVTVGYGDITPKNQLELFFANVLMLCSTCMFAYSMNSIGIIVKNLYDIKLKYKRQLTQINAYMTSKKISKHLQSRVRNYIKFAIQQEVEENQEELNSILSSLPQGLQNQMKQEISSNIIEKIGFLKQYFTKQSRDKLTQCLEMQEYTSGDYIFHKNENNTNLYYLEKGQVQLVDEQSSKIMYQIKQGEYFGFHSFFTGYKTEIAARTSEVTKVYIIRREVAVKIFRDRQKDWEVFHSLKDNIIFNKDYSFTSIYCNFCSQIHKYMECTNIYSYNPNLETVYKKQQYQEQSQERMEYDRENDKSNTLCINYELIKSVSDYRQENLKEEIEQINYMRTKTLIVDQNKLQMIEKDVQPSISNLKNQYPERRSTMFIKYTKNKSREQSIINSLSSFKNIQQSQLTSFKDSFEIDKMKNYYEYKPEGNIANQARKYNTFTISQIPQHLIKSVSKYSFNLKVIELASKIRQKLSKKRIIGNRIFKLGLK